MEQFSLKKLEDFLSKEEYRCILLEPTKEEVLPKLALFVGADRQGRERTIEIFLRDQYTEANVQSEKTEALYCTLQIVYVFPFRATDMTVSDTARLVAFLNRQFEIPGLEFDEVSGMLLYRHVSLLHKKNVEMTTITGMIGIIMLFLEMFSDTLEQVATGVMTTNEILEMAVLAVEK